MSSNWLRMVLLLLATQGAFGNHFRGGSMSWKPVPGEDQIDLTYKVDYTATFATNEGQQCTETSLMNPEVELKGSGTINCDRCPDDTLRLKWLCDGLDTDEDSSYGHYTIRYDVPQPQFIISHESCCWITLQSPVNPTSGVKRWKMLAEVDFRDRPDNGKKNSSPVSANVPTEKFFRGCQYVLRIPASDPDNDVVRCRFAKTEQDECHSSGSKVCGADTAGLTINKKDCTLSFNPSNIAEGHHAVNVIIEDYIRPFKWKTSTPLSRVSLLFLLNVKGNNTECKKPIIVDPPYCKVVRPGEHFEMVVRADPGDSLRPIAKIKILPGGKVTSMTSSGLQDDPDTENHPNRKIKILSWYPTEDHVEDSVCYSALDEDGFTSGLSCTFIYVDADPLQPDNTSSTPVENGVIFAGSTWIVRFNHKIQKPKTSALIKIVNPENDQSVFEVDTSSTSVTFTSNSIEFLPPQEALSTDIQYKLQIEEGVAMRAAGGCGSVAAEWQISVHDNEAEVITRPPGPTKPNKPPVYECEPGTLELFLPNHVAKKGQECFIHLANETVVLNGGVIKTPYNLCCPSSCENGGPAPLGGPGTR